MLLLTACPGCDAYGKLTHMPGEKKRPAVQARKAQQQMTKGARRRSRTGSGPRRSDVERLSYGHRQGLSITVQIPPLRKPQKPTRSSLQQLLRKMSRPKVFVPLGIVLVVAGIIVLNGSSSSPATQPVTAADRTAPDFQPLKPSAEKASTVKYDGKRNLVSYTTHFSGSRITVSQQPLPPNFKKDSRSLSRAADSINAKQRIDTAKGPLYVANNEEGNDQMAILAAQTVLLFIHADRKLDDASWKSFVELLKIES